METQLNLFDNVGKKHNCRNCTSCFFISNYSGGVANNEIRCIHGLVNKSIGCETNYFIDCHKYNEDFYSKWLGFPKTEAESYNHQKMDWKKL